MGRTMAWTGLALFAFIAFHILHFTIGQVQPGYFHQLDPKERYDAYSMFVYGFQNPAIYAVYFAGMIILALHLGHGAASWLQSLGLTSPSYARVTGAIGPVLAVVVFAGNCSMPIYVLLHYGMR